MCDSGKPHAEVSMIQMQSELNTSIFVMDGIPSAKHSRIMMENSCNESIALSSDDGDNMKDTTLPDELKPDQINDPT